MKEVKPELLIDYDKKLQDKKWKQNKPSKGHKENLNDEKSIMNFKMLTLVIQQNYHKIKKKSRHIRDLFNG